MFGFARLEIFAYVSIHDLVTGEVVDFLQHDFDGLLVKSLSFDDAISYGFFDVLDEVSG